MNVKRRVASSTSYPRVVVCPPSSCGSGSREWSGGGISLFMLFLLIFLHCVQPKESKDQALLMAIRVLFPEHFWDRSPNCVFRVVMRGKYEFSSISERDLHLCSFYRTKIWDRQVSRCRELATKYKIPFGCHQISSFQSVRESRTNENRSNIGLRAANRFSLSRQKRKD